jgi:uncharacterized membrane protein
MKKEKENLRESKLTCNINLYKIKSAEMFAEFISNEEEEFYMICPKCGSEMPDDSAFCTRCGASLHTGTQENQNSQGTPYGYGNPQGNNGAYYGNPQMNNGMPYGQPYVDPKDHSTEFDGKDIAEHKLFAMLPYLLGILGTIVALLVAKDSPYVGFHVREGIRILVSEVLLGLITVVLCWTVVVPIAAAVCFIILLVVRIISFVNVCNGKAKEAAIVSNFGFLK